MQGDTEQSELRDSSLHLRNVHQEGVEVLTFSNILGLATLHHDRAPSCYGEQKIIWLRVHVYAVFHVYGVQAVVIKNQPYNISIF